jgi:hypothetical protein
MGREQERIGDHEPTDHNMEQQRQVEELHAVLWHHTIQVQSLLVVLIEDHLVDLIGEQEEDGANDVEHGHTARVAQQHKQSGEDTREGSSALEVLTGVKLVEVVLN